MCKQLIIEAVVVGVLTVVVGLLTAAILKNVGTTHMGFYTKISVWLFCTGAAIHLVCQATGINKYYCNNGYACMQ
jgi:hypothetical protein